MIWYSYPLFFQEQTGRFCITAQHFLLSSKSRTLTPIEMAQLSDESAHRLLCRIRWGGEGHVVCPKCRIRHKAYRIASRRQWRCRFCNHTFSVTSGTVFAGRKLSIQHYLYAIALFANAAKWLSACHLSRDLNVQYKTAFTLAHKIRESLLVKEQTEPLCGEVHIDGTYIHTYVRPKNRKTDRIDRRLKENANPDKRAVMVMRSRYSREETEVCPYAVGAKRTLTFPVMSETAAVAEKLAGRYIKAGSRIHADENPAYDGLIVRYDLRRVNHQREYGTSDGINNNLAESYFGRFKRMIVGTYHKIGNRYLDCYAGECAYREDHRRYDNRRLFDGMLERCLCSVETTDWRGYWQGRHRTVERLVA
ncbi:TPA: IS1595 family transposase [Neisseria lactamica]